MNAVLACGLADLTEGAALRVVLDGRPVALVRFGDEVHAIDDTCLWADRSGGISCDRQHGDR